jgi:hypothetical protein
MFGTPVNGLARLRGLRFRGLLVAAIVGLIPCINASAGPTDYQQGQGSSPITGAAGTGGSQGDSGLDHCDRPMGAMAVLEPQGIALQSLTRYSLSSPTSLIRMMIQQSNCFLVVERGAAMQNMQQERALASSGQLRGGSNMGGGQMVSADFILTPNVVFSENNAGGVGAGIGGLLGGRAALVGGLVGGLKFKEAQTSMLVADARSGIQVASAEGSTRKADFRLGAALFGGGGGGGVGGYGNTNEGKIIAAAFLDNYKKIVAVVRGDPSLQRSVGTLAQEAAAGGATQSGEVFNEGDIVVPKIANVKLFADSSDSGKAVATLGKGEELVVIGPEKNGYLNVQSGAASGWIKRVLITRGR